ncbi:mannose-6-phosphate isomerase [Anastrepha ludens]|uniref:mannose-6-phosphate isomerase n=1 Tax=Anastrepha ludens TaxID=28586 RepID=UPI0023B1847C|nr:mannose-6-phosphate isomerase [Anastrepha ludens]
MELVGFVHKYEWGKLGNDSAVAQLATLNDPEFKVDLNTPYAELWMGSHPNGPSKYKSSGTKLEEELPFLLKVLSINKALSIQVHPNKVEAQQLHLKEPTIYKDPNHKPEMAIALTPFVGLCGFRPLPEIRDILMSIQPLKELTVDDPKQMDLLMANDEEGLRYCYKKLMNTDATTIGQCIETISRDYSELLSEYELLKIFNKLKVDFPNDVGVLSLFFLNVVRLEPGQAMFLGANQIHAYLSGDVVECMACSDNVIRAGLTPKYKDIKQLLNSLEYNGAPPSSKIFVPERFDNQRLLFKPPVEDFALTQLTLRPADKEYVLKIDQSPGILLVLNGQRTLKTNTNNGAKLKRGSIVYLPWEIGTEVHFVSSEESENDFLAYISTPNAP